MISEVTVRRRAAKAVALAGVAGFFDAAGYLVLQGLFPAHMSGNSARLGVGLGMGNLIAAAIPTVAVAVFVLSGAAGQVVADLAARRRCRSPAGLVLAVEAMLVAAFLGYGQSVLSQHPVGPVSASFWVLEALAVSAMGLQTSAVRTVGGQGVRTTFVSGVLAQFAEALGHVVVRGRPSRGPRPRFRLLLTGSIWTGYVLSAAGGAALELRWQLWSLAIPLAVLCAVVVVEWRRP